MSRPDLAQRYLVSRDRFRIAEHDPADTAGLDRKRARKLQAEDLERLASLQKRLYAEQRQALLVVLQGIDTSGKDGTIAHVMSGLNPSAVRATAFKRPSPPELAHDWLWRCVVALPERGQIGIFNRSHYEEVITLHVHPEQLAAEAVDPQQARDERFWKARMKTIEVWERHLVACQTHVVKFFLHISKEEQYKRLLERATNPEKQWKFTPDDVTARGSWDAYQEAYEAAVRATSSLAAPWYAIPADHKWMARTAVAQIVVHHLERMNPSYPVPDEQAARAAAEALALLEAEG